jgi:RNA polymerase sigma-70 factor (ECF subfamily)
MKERKLNSDLNAKKLKAIPEGEFASEPKFVEDNELFIRQVFQKNPEEACGLLFKQYYSVLCNHAVRFVYSQRMAEDIVAEVFEKFWAHKSFETIISYRNYLFISLRNACLNHLKAEFKHKGLLDLSVAESHESSGQNPYQHIKMDELSKAIEAAIQSLPEKCQTVFLMSSFEGKKNHEIATELGLTLKAIEGHMTRALSKLKKVIVQDYL